METGQGVLLPAVVKSVNRDSGGRVVSYTIQVLGRVILSTGGVGLESPSVPKAIRLKVKR